MIKLILLTKPTPIWELAFKQVKERKMKQYKKKSSQCMFLNWTYRHVSVGSTWC